VLCGLVAHDGDCIPLLWRTPLLLCVQRRFFLARSGDVQRRAAGLPARARDGRNESIGRMAERRQCPAWTLTKSKRLVRGQCVPSNLVELRRHELARSAPDGEHVKENGC
jgi:hypothetical protein